MYDDLRRGSIRCEIKNHIKERSFGVIAPVYFSRDDIFSYLLLFRFVCEIRARNTRAENIQGEKKPSIVQAVFHPSAK